MALQHHWKDPRTDTAPCSPCRQGTRRFAEYVRNHNPIVCSECKKAFLSWHKAGRQKRAKIIQDAREQGESLLLFSDPDYDTAILGVASRPSQPSLVAYDRELCIQHLIGMGMTREGAEEFFSFNTEGAWVGEQTPLILDSVGDMH